MPTTTVPPPASTPDAKRDAILDAALDLFSERTFDGTPVPLIATTAGVAAGTIYRYFPSKEALVNALYRRWKVELRRVILDGIAGGTSVREQFGLLWCGLWQFGAEHPRAITFLETHHHASYIDDESRALGQQIEEASAAFIREAQARGEIRKADPRIITSLVMGAFTGLVKKAGPGAFVLDERAMSESEELMWSALQPTK